MPVEVRELVIKTEIVTTDKAAQSQMQSKDITELKNELLEACRKMLTAQHRRTANRR